MIKQIATKIMITPVIKNEVKFSRNYIFNNSFITESFSIIEDVLSNNYGIATKLTKIAKSYLRKNEDILIGLRNFAIYSTTNKSDWIEFNNKINLVSYELMIEKDN